MLKKTIMKWLKASWLVVVLALIIVGFLVYTVVNETSSVNASSEVQTENTELQERLEALEAQNMVAKEAKAKAEAEKAANVKAEAEKTELAKLIEEAEAKAKAEAEAELLAKIEAEKVEKKESDFVSVPADKKFSKTPPEWVGLEEVDTVIGGIPVVVGVPLIKTPVGAMPYIGDMTPDHRFDWKDASWMRLNVALQDGEYLQMRRGFRPIFQDSERTKLVVELWVLVPNSAAAATSGNPEPYPQLSGKG